MLMDFDKFGQLWFCLVGFAICIKIGLYGVTEFYDNFSTLLYLREQVFFHLACTLDCLSHWPLQFIKSLQLSCLKNILACMS